MGQQSFDESDRAIDARLDKDFEREHGYRTPVRVPLNPRGTLRTLLGERRAAGVLQPMLPERIVTRHDGDKRCDCTSCCKIDPSRIGRK